MRRVVLVAALLAALVLSIWFLLYLTSGRGSRFASRISQVIRPGARHGGEMSVEERLRGIAQKLGAKPEDIKVRPGRQGAPQAWTVAIPANQSLLKCNVAVTEAVQDVGGRVLDGFESVSADGVPFLRMKLEIEGSENHTITFQKSGKIPPVLRACLAIVIDDLGYGNEDLLEEFLKLDYPLTFSVLPGYGKSRRTAEAVLKSGKELFLHLPMEPHGYPSVKPGKLPILVDLSPGEIKERLAKHLNSLPDVVGVNNHMGSLATQDPEVMKAILEETKRRGLIFLDSMTDPGAVSMRVAREIGAPCLENDLFLDRIKNDEKTVRKAFERAKRIALARGRAIAIGHLYAGTLNVLKEELPELEASGISLAAVSGLAEANQARAGGK
ncbi:MAG: divergent polysaccharide deacetylase family protein [Candidatus Eisenbacteria bacterium]